MKSIAVLIRELVLETYKQYSAVYISGVYCKFPLNTVHIAFLLIQRDKKSVLNKLGSTFY